MARVLLVGGTVLTMNAARDVFHDGAVLVEHGRIVFAGSHAAVPLVPVDDTVEMSGKVVMPGLVNAHAHLGTIFGRTIGLDRELLAWVEVQRPLIQALDEEALYRAELLACVENLKNGNTTVIDNIFSPHPVHFVPAVAALRAMETSGIRGTLARGVLGREFHASFLETAAEQGDRVERLVKEWHGVSDGRLRIAVAPLLPWAMTDELYRETRRLADRFELGIHMHVAATHEFNRLIGRHFGRSVRHVELLRDVGCLGPTVHAVGVADLSARELELLAETGTTLAFDPANRRDAAPLLDAGPACGLATTDGASHAGFDLFERMRGLGAHRRALAMATIEGARAVGLGEAVGSLESGKRADLITIDLRQSHLAPVFDVEAALVGSARGGDVRDVMIDGRWVVWDRQVLTVDEPSLIADATAAARRCAAEAGLDTSALPPGLDGS